MTEHAKTKWKDVIRALQDADCKKSFIELFIELLETDQRKKAQLLLKEHRQVLLDRCHREEQRINCLDYLSYQMDHNKI